MNGLTELEKQVLRMVLEGHDAKSIARTLGLSVHTINERLRDARRKFGVSSSREAARRLAAFEGGHKFVVDKEFGIDAASPNESSPSAPGHRARAAGPTLPLIWLGPIMLGTALTAVAAFVLFAGNGATPAAAGVAPRVVATFPAPGAVVPAGPLTLRVTYDRPMRRANYSFVQVSPETYPQCDRRPRRSRDGRTFSLSCRVESGRRYEVWFNRPPYMNFKGMDLTPAEPFRLSFRVR